jgi:hypothetical protein
MLTLRRSAGEKVVALHLYFGPLPARQLSASKIPTIYYG